MNPTSPSRSLALLPFLFWVLALSYLAMMHLEQYPLHYIHKASPILLLLFFASKHVLFNYQLVGLAIVFSVFGDILLALQIEQGFVMGLSAFLIAQCCYGLAFQRWRHWQKHKAFMIAALLLSIIVVALFVVPASDNLYVPVVVYMLAICFMACSAILVKTDDYLILIGAIFFVISDALIAVNKFVVPLPFEGYWVMSTYYLAQYLIVLGCLKRINDAQRSY
ncbi:MAG: lysoplasmalogenase [Aliiglaciecola sp.]|uniref:lysoplasmalogenase n=1 Tax=Aliiglaciecola sp. M165 TaxID=2593649 RepID=UPI00117F48A9|nr:lysoplasmalogenase [Aliiglaciecola sp. M165]TRY32959.1 lysoplasmalogenase [Aliiglaciecola sp. M165]